ncbi:MAG: isoleucine--tRNA ligase [Desulfobacteraceae bacterium 4484_190.3]|nr:MAG: isoleucine--tRNA ligase [Desulfobacteraceae bacterium 4484_190.3]
MKANLSKKEPEMLKKWEGMHIYDRIREVSKGRKTYILHDGPPYANGDIHLGTALNKIIKDIVIKSKNMMGFDAIYVPGWDCHGLPIEHQVDKELGEKQYSLSQVEKRRLCRKYAKEYLDIQRKQFKRLGVFGDWSNPYITMDYDYEATTVKELGKLLLSGDVYKGEKPVYWCASCKTALAEAEVEYADHTTPSIYVKFPMISDISSILPALAGEKVSVVIWTTTPWTIPANLAIALHEDFDYIAVKVKGEVLIIAEELLDYCMDAFGYRDEKYEVLSKFNGKVVEGLKCKHPFIDRESVLILAPFVTLDAGTGCVHIAPGHGQEDYEIGLEYGLNVYAPVDDDGNFTPDVDYFAGQFVFDANDAVNEKLREVGALLGLVNIKHQYPHCWRCKNPIIFRSTEQWFISMEKNELRKKALEAIDRVSWVPSWGRDRIYGMIKNRPDWCISRQRVWGVPITVFYCKQCNNVLYTKEMLDHVAALIKEHGADVWYERDEKDLLPEGTVCPVCQGKEFKKETNILDVWFDSGVSHAAVLENTEKWEDLQSPADMYLEGSDQHRGWFHSSLLESVGTRGRAPYKSVLTHGFVVDGAGKKMSKSMGNVIDPQKMVDKDKAALNRLQEIIRRVRTAYENYQFHVVFYALHNYCTVDLSALYLDVLKDRLYTSKSKSRERKSAQSAMYIILDAMVRLLSPILTFTAEEIWENLPDYDGKEESVHMTLFPNVNPDYVNKDIGEVWGTLIHIKSEVSKAIEIARQEKVVGHSLDSRIDIFAPEKFRSLLERYAEDIKALFIVSEVNVLEEDKVNNPYESTEFEGLKIGVAKAHGQKCERCWHYSMTVGNSPDYPTICQRCIGNLE